MPPGQVLRGVVFGLLYALTSVGIVLIYRANRVINFAQAEIGSVAAIVAIELVIHGVPYFIGVPIGLVVAAVLGAGVERRRDPPLPQSAATHPRRCNNRRRADPARVLHHYPLGVGRRSRCQTVRHAVRRSVLRAARALLRRPPDRVDRCAARHGRSWSVPAVHGIRHWHPRRCRERRPSPSPGHSGVAIVDNGVGPRRGAQRAHRDSACSPRGLRVLHRRVVSGQLIVAAHTCCGCHRPDGEPAPRGDRVGRDRRVRSLRGLEPSQYDHR